MNEGRRRISSGSSFESIAGYGRAVVDGDFILVAGTTGYDDASTTFAPEVATQTHQAFGNILAVLTEADAGLDDVARVRYCRPDAAEFPLVAPIFGQYLGAARPAATALICSLIEPAMRIEIEAMARKRR